MKYYIVILFYLNTLLIWCQDNFVETHFSEVDSTYREDQFYVGLGINFLIDKPQEMTQSGLSGGLHFGYVRDMPLNKRRNVAIGLGLGLSVDTYSQNLFIGEDDVGQNIFDVIDANVEFSKNRFSTYTLEAPVHFRWRTSNPGDDTSFWRIYTGFNFGYIYFFKSSFEQIGNKVTQTNIDELNRFRYDFYFSFGKSKINFFFRYSLNSFFDAELKDSNTPVNVSVIKAGLVFYLL